MMEQILSTLPLQVSSLKKQKQSMLGSSCKSVSVGHPVFTHIISWLASCVQQRLGGWGDGWMGGWVPPHA